MKNLPISILVSYILLMFSCKDDQTQNCTFNDSNCYPYSVTFEDSTIVIEEGNPVVNILIELDTTTFHLESQGDSVNCYTTEDVVNPPQNCTFYNESCYPYRVSFIDSIIAIDEVDPFITTFIENGSNTIKIITGDNNLQCEVI